MKRKERSDIFEKNFNKYMKGGSVESFKRAYKTLYKVIMETINEIENEKSKQ